MYGPNRQAILPAGCVELTNASEIGHWTPNLRLEVADDVPTIVDLSLPPTGSWALHAWSFISRSTRGTHQIRPRSLDFKFPETSSSLPISLLRIQELEWATKPDAIYIQCDRCSSVSVGDTEYAPWNGYFVIPFAKLPAAIDAICTNLSAAFCRITDRRFTGSVAKLATFSVDAGVIDLNEFGTATRLFPDLTRQIITGNKTDGLRYEKTWIGTVEFTDLPVGILAYEINPVNFQDQRVAYIRAYLGGLSVPFSPFLFRDGTTAGSKLSEFQCRR
jgi:hypothetical protein